MAPANGHSARSRQVKLPLGVKNASLSTSEHSHKKSFDRLGDVVRVGLFVLLLGFCTTTVSTEDSKQTVRKDVPESTNKVTLAEVLNSNPTSKDYETTQRCISKSAIRSHEVLDHSTVVFTLLGKGRPKYVVQFGKNCRGLTRESAIHLESLGSTRVCSGDWLRTQTYEFGRRTWGPRCNSPGFEPITDHQLALLKEAFVTARST